MHAGDGAADIELDGKRCVDFCSNDYLGLAAHPRVTEAFIAAAREHGVGARAQLTGADLSGADAMLEESASTTAIVPMKRAICDFL